MAAGQLAGGLAWLAISGEDAPELGYRSDPARQHDQDEDRSRAHRGCRYRIVTDHTDHDAVTDSVPDRGRYHRGFPSVGKDDPVVVQDAGETQQFRPKANFVARRHSCRSALFHSLGWHCRSVDSGPHADDTRNRVYRHHSFLDPANQSIAKH